MLACLAQESQGYHIRPTSYLSLLSCSMYRQAHCYNVQADGQDMGRQASSHMEHVQQSLDDFGLAPQRVRPAPPSSFSCASGP